MHSSVFALLFLFLIGPRAADAATISRPIANAIGYIAKIGTPNNTNLGYMSVNSLNSWSHISWRLDTNCSTMFQLRNYHRTSVNLYTKTDIPYLQEETAYNCKLTVNERGYLSIAPFSIAIILQNYTCVFDETLPAGSVCPILQQNKSGLSCYNYGSAPGLNVVFTINRNPCQIKTIGTFNRERMSATGYRTRLTVYTHSSSYATVTVDIAFDVNLNSPSCSQRRSILTWPEDVLVPDFEITAMNCTDSDIGKSSEMVCATKSSGFYAKMRDQTCSLRLTAPLHYETPASWLKTAVVTVRDNSHLTSSRRTVTYSYTVIALPRGNSAIYPTVSTIGNGTPQSIAYSSEVKKQIKVVFAVSLAFQEPFEPKLADKTSAEFLAHSEAIEEKLRKTYRTHFSNATAIYNLVVVTGFRKGSTHVDCTVYFVKPVETGPINGLTIEKMKDITREALTGWKLTLFGINVEASGLSFEPLPVTAPADIPHLKVEVEATTTELFQEAFSNISSNFGATARSQFHQRLSVGFSGAKNLRAVALSIKSLRLDRSSAGTIVAFEVAFKSLSAASCSDSVLQEVLISAIITADFGIIRVKAVCPLVQGVNGTTYVTTIGSPKNTHLGHMSISSKSGSNIISWRLDSSCRTMFELRDQSRTFANLYTKTAIPSSQKETYYNCKLHVSGSGNVSIASFTVIALLKNYTCSFEENAPAGSVCPTFLRNISGLYCSPLGSTPGLGVLFSIITNPCRIKTIGSFDRERMSQIRFRALLRVYTVISSWTTVNVDIAFAIVNDKSPSCSPRRSILTWHEDVLVKDFEIIAMKCTDANAEQSSKLVCATKSSGFYAKMRDQTCSIRLTAPLHYETSASWLKTVVVAVSSSAFPTSARRTVTHSFTVIALPRGNSAIYPIVSTIGNETAQSIAFSSSEAKKKMEVAFVVSLTFQDPFVDNLKDKKSREFQAHSETIKVKLTRKYRAQFPNTAVVVVVTEFKKGSTHAECNCLFAKPVEAGPINGLTMEKIKEITREALKGWKLTLSGIKVEVSGLNFKSLPVTAPASVSNLKVDVEVTTTELFQHAFADSSSKSSATARSQFHQRLSVGFNGAKNLRAVALSIKSLRLDRSSAGTIVAFEVAFKSLSAASCSDSVLQEVVTSAVITADFGIIRVKVACPSSHLPSYAVALIVIVVLLCVAIVIGVIVVVWWKRNRQQSNASSDTGNGMNLDGYTNETVYQSSS